MGINNIRLSPALMAALYPESLVAITENSPAKKRVNHDKKAPVPVYPFLGKNLRSICFLVDYPDHSFIPDEKRAFVSKMLNACKCSMEDIALINIASQPVQIDELRKQLNPAIIFLWGLAPAQIGITRKEFQDLQISAFDNIDVLPVQFPDLVSGDSAEGTALKKRLWTALKKLFNL